MESSHSKAGWVVNDLAGTPDDIAEKMQEFFGSIEQEWRKSRRDGGEVKEKDVEVREVREIMERVEKAICETFYDR